MPTTQPAESVEITPQQKAEWHDLHDQMQKLFKEAEGADRMAAHLLAAHVAAGGMTPAEFGLPSREALEDYRRACEYAVEASAARAERERLSALVDAHPYTPVAKSRMPL